MSINVQVRDRGQIVATLRVLDEATVQGEGILYADVDADTLLAVAGEVQAGREAVFTPAVPVAPEQPVAEAPAEEAAETPGAETAEPAEAAPAEAPAEASEPSA